MYSIFCVISLSGFFIVSFAPLQAQTPPSAAGLCDRALAQEADALAAGTGEPFDRNQAACLPVSAGVDVKEAVDLSSWQNQKREELLSKRYELGKHKSVLDLARLNYQKKKEKEAGKIKTYENLEEASVIGVVVLPTLGLAVATILSSLELSSGYALLPFGIGFALGLLSACLIPLWHYLSEKTRDKYYQAADMDKGLGEAIDYHDKELKDINEQLRHLPSGQSVGGNH